MRSTGRRNVPTPDDCASVSSAPAPVLLLHWWLPRCGRRNLAGTYLPRVSAPCLLLVGALDREVLQLNREAMRLLFCEKRLEIVPGATHLFEEPAALDVVVHQAADWFVSHLGPQAHRH
jgi:putative phosphoribosyl transferase